MASALVVIDVQNDFCTGGPLAVPDAEAVMPVVNALLPQFAHVIFTQDWHPAGHVSFASSHAGLEPLSRIMLPGGGEQMLWPDHCIADTPGADFPLALRLPAGRLVVRKGVRRDIDSYSAFFENDHQTPVGLDRLLRSRGVDDLVLVGLATDFCVLRTAVDARRLGYATTVIEAGCRGIDVGGSLADAWARMLQAGVTRG
jgi:nicotinamidase-related amidase